MKTEKENAYVIYCKPNTVVFGYATAREIRKKSPTIKRSRLLVYWSSDTRGVFGAAAQGPGSTCRVSPPVIEHTICTEVEGFTLCSDEAVERWERGPWG